MDYIVHGILQARILEWVAIPFSRGSSQPRHGTQVSCITGGFLPAEPPMKPQGKEFNSVQFSRSVVSDSCLLDLVYQPRFPDSSAGKESTCNAGDPDLIPGLGRSAGKGIGYPLQYSWASLVAQLVKNPPTMREAWVQSLSWEGPLEKGKATHSSILAWRIPWTV